MSAPAIAASSSVLAADALADWVAAEFGLGPAIECRLVSRGANDVYRVESGQGVSYLRISPHGWRSLPQIEAEVCLIDELHRSGVRVARAMHPSDGAAVREAVAPEGTRLAVLFEAAPGRQVDAPAIAQAAALGRAAARVHLAADAMPSQPARFAIDERYLLTEPLAAIWECGLEAPADLGYVASMAERVRARIASLPRGAGIFGMCHGDLHPANARFAADGTPTLFDFDLCGYGWRIYDLAVFLWNAAGEQRTRRWTESRWRAFLRGYGDERNLSADELEAVPLFLVARQVWLMGLDCRGQSGWPVQWLNERWLRDMLRPIRGWETEHSILRP
jgi:Ser/Thr protein kinase RdoA (MazF antagonist)